jgi:hypothetical protein
MPSWAQIFLSSESVIGEMLIKAKSNHCVQTDSSRAGAAIFVFCYANVIIS